MGFLCLVTGYKKYFGPKELKIKMSSVMSFVFTLVELCVVTINEKPWTRARKVCKALRYEKKTANTVKNHCSKENYTQAYQMSSVPAAGTPVDWPEDSQKFDIYINEEGMYELLFSRQQPKAKAIRKHSAMYCFLMFYSSLVISHMRWKLKALQAVSRCLRLQMRSINKPSKKKMQQLYC